MNKFYTFSSVSIVDFEQVVMFADLNTLLLWVELSFLWNMGYHEIQTFHSLNLFCIMLAS